MKGIAGMNTMRMTSGGGGGGGGMDRRPGNDFRDRDRDRPRDSHRERSPDRSGYAICFRKFATFACRLNLFLL